MDRWRAYETEWSEHPDMEDLYAHVSGWHKAKNSEPVPMTEEEFFKKYPRVAKVRINKGAFDGK